MKKIISLFARNYEGDRLVRDEIVPGAEWVVAGEGYASEKYDGTCCLVDDGTLFRRYDAKAGKVPPAGFIAAQGPDPVTGHWPGWLRVTDDPSDQWHREAWENTLYEGLDGQFSSSAGLPDGTYELVGPKVQGNPYGLNRHWLWPHGTRYWCDVPRDYAGLRDWLTARPKMEGIVWWRSEGPDADMVKIKRRDFGLPWPPVKASAMKTPAEIKELLKRYQAEVARNAIDEPGWTAEAQARPLGRLGRSIDHEHLSAIVIRRPADYYQHRNRETARDGGFAPDCASGCRWYAALAGPLGADWGVCCNPKSQRCGLLTSEHMGCSEFEAEG